MELLDSHLASQLFDALYPEFEQHQINNLMNLMKLPTSISYVRWEEWVNSLNIGIRATYRTDAEMICDTFEYFVSDPQQWCITRLRYGIV